MLLYRCGSDAMVGAKTLNKGNLDNIKEFIISLDNIELEKQLIFLVFIPPTPSLFKEKIEMPILGSIG
jgi:hypothetical protein